MKTDITLVLDRSGSMSSIAKTVIDEFNDFIKEQRTIPGECSASLVLFDDKYDTVFAGKDIHSVPMLTSETYVPQGYTALLGAIGRAIKETGDRLRNLPEDQRPEKVLFIVQTDGGENYSSAMEWSISYTREKVAEMVQHQTDKYNWTFVFMGANQDSFLTGAQYGYAKGNTSNWDATVDGTKDGYAKMKDATRSYRTSNEVKTCNFFG